MVGFMMVFHLAPSNLTWQWYILIETIIYIYIYTMEKYKVRTPRYQSVFNLTKIRTIVICSHKL